jgi:hypothetical protein
VQLLVEKDLETLSSKLHYRHSSVVTQPRAHYVSEGKSYSNILNALQQEGITPLPASIGNESRNSGDSISSTEWVALIEASVRDFNTCVLKY